MVHCYPRAIRNIGNVSRCGEWAGPHHLLLFLPSVVWGFVVLRREVWAGLSDARTRARYEGFSLGLMAALLLGYGPIVVTSWGTVLHRFAYAQFILSAKAEIDSALEDNRDLKVAVGPGRLSVNADPAAFDPVMLRVIPVFRGHPLPLDSAVWINFQAEGIGDDPIRRAITECRVDLWVLPAGAPFVTISHYNGEDIFSPQVLADFHATYVKQRSGRIFDLWRCKRDGAASRKIQEAR